MSGASSETTAVLDIEALPLHPHLPSGADRVVLTFQCSPQRRAILASHFSRASFVEAVPGANGAWNMEAEADLDALGRLDVSVEGVPLLDCYRASWREEVTALRALRHGVGGAGRVAAAAGSPSARRLEVVAGRGGLARLDVVEGPSAGRQRRPSVIARMRGGGLRGTALALSARLDPAHARRARLRRRPRLARAATLVVSSYAHATRAALEALAASGGGPAVLLRTGPGATRGLALPANLRCLPLATALSLDRAGARAARTDAVAAVERALASWGDPGDAWAPWPAIEATSFGRALRRVLLGETISGIFAVRSLLRATEARVVAVGDEFSFLDRAAIHAARAMGVSSVSRQHGVLDAHYLTDRILADEHLAWDEPTRSWLSEHGAIGERVVRVLPRAPAGPPPARGHDSVVVFLQPTDLVRVPFSDWLAEALPAVVRAARAQSLGVVLKPHPLQTTHVVLRGLPPALRGEVRIVAGRSARELLLTAAAAVTLDSSVAVDCRDLGVPCFSTAWYRGAYVRDLVSLGYVQPCATPEALEAALRAARRAAPRR